MMLSVQEEFMSLWREGIRKELMMFLEMKNWRDVDIERSPVVNYAQKKKLRFYIYADKRSNKGN